MSFGDFTYSSLTRQTDYSALLQAARDRQAKAKSESTSESSEDSEQTPKTKPADPRTAQALIWGGLVPELSKTNNWQSSASTPTSQSAWEPENFNKSPELNLSYDFVTLQSIISYGEVLRARNPDANTSIGQNISSKS